MVSYFHFMVFSLISSCIIVTDANTNTKNEIRMSDTHISLQDEQEVFSNDICKFIEYIESKGYKVTLGEAYRTHEQALIYAQEGLGIKNSLHCERLAMDLNIFTSDGKMLTTVADFEPFGIYWENLNPWNVWGGRWKHRPDADHFQMDPEQNS